MKSVYDQIKVSYKWDDSQRDHYKVKIQYKGKQYTFDFSTVSYDFLNKIYFISALIRDYVAFDKNDGCLDWVCSEKKMKALEKNYDAVVRMFNADEIEELYNAVCQKR